MLGFSGNLERERVPCGERRGGGSGGGSGGVCVEPNSRCSA